MTGVFLRVVLVYIVLDSDGAKSIENEVNNGVSEDGNNQTNDSVEDGVFGVGDFFAVAAGKDIAKTAPN